MKFYQVQTPEGPQLVGTQADAKPFGPIKAVEVPVDKDGLMAWINEQMPKPVQSVDEDYQNAEEIETVRPISTARRIVAEIDGVCPVCARTTRGTELLLRGNDADEINERILELEGFALAKVVGAVLERMERLAKEKLNEPEAPVAD